MNTLLVGIIVLLTILAAMVLGIALGYWLFVTILHAFGAKPESAHAPALVTGHASMGD